VYQTPSTRQMHRGDTIPINKAKAIADLGGEESIFYEMIDQIEGLSLNEESEQLYNAVMQMNHKEIKFHGHKIRGPLSYIAADRAVALLTAIEAATDHQDERGVISKYLQLLEALRALKIYLAKERGRTPNTSDIDKYERNVKAKFFPPIELHQPDPNERPPGCCAACNIF